MLIVAVCDGAVILSRHATDRALAADRAGIVAVCNGADPTTILSDHTTDRALAADLAGIVAVFDGAALYSLQPRRRHCCYR